MSKHYWKYKRAPGDEAVIAELRQQVAAQRDVVAAKDEALRKIWLGSSETYIADTAEEAMGAVAVPEAEEAPQ